MRPPHIDIDSPQAAALIPYAKREIERVRKTLRFGKRRIKFPTGEEITIWWGGLVDKIRIITKRFEVLVATIGSGVAGVAPFSKLMGLKLDQSTGLYVPDLSQTIDNSFGPFPDSLHFTVTATAADKDHTTAAWFTDQLGIGLAYIERHEGATLSPILSPFHAAGPTTLHGEQAIATGRFIEFPGAGSIISIRTLGVSTSVEAGVFPTFDANAFLARANAAWPLPFEQAASGGFTGATWMVQRRGDTPQFIVWRRPAFIFAGVPVRLAMYMERYSIDAELVDVFAPTGTGLTLIESVSTEESHLSGGVSGVPYTYITPGIFNTTQFATDIDNTGLLIAARNDGSTPLPFQVGGVNFRPSLVSSSPFTVGLYPTTIQVLVAGSSFTLLDGTVGPGFSIPWRFMEHLGKPHVTQIRVEDDEYLFLDAISFTTGLTFFETSGGVDMYEGDGVFEITWSHVVFKNGTVVHQSADTRTYTAATDSWDDNTSVFTFYPTDGHRLDEGDFFIGTRIEEQMGLAADWAPPDVPVAFRNLPTIYKPAVFTADHHTTFTYSIPVQNRALDVGGYFIGQYLGKLFYVYPVVLAGDPKPTAFGVPVDQPTATPVQIDPDFVHVRVREQITARAELA
jgi:hypothetical protein